jgi:hypothetical protein
MNVRPLALLAPALLVSACCARPCRPCAAPCPPPCQSPCAQAGTPLPPAPRLAQASDTEGQIFLQSTIVRIPGAAAERLLGARRATTNPSSELLPFARAEELLKQVTADPAATLLQMPTILTFSGQEATIFTGEDYAEAPHRPADRDPYTNALEDPSWSGIDLRVLPAVLADRTGISLELGFVARAVPPKGEQPDLARLQADQIAARLTVLRVASGDSVLVVASAKSADASGDRILLVVTPKILHAEVAAAPTPQRTGTPAGPASKP